jgi:hypothetical protein
MQGEYNESAQDKRVWPAGRPPGRDRAMRRPARQAPSGVRMYACGLPGFTDRPAVPASTCYDKSQAIFGRPSSTRFLFSSAHEFHMVVPSVSPRSHDFAAQLLKCGKACFSTFQQLFLYNLLFVPRAQSPGCEKKEPASTNYQGMFLICGCRLYAVVPSHYLFYKSSSISPFLQHRACPISCRP